MKTLTATILTIAIALSGTGACFGAEEIPMAYLDYATSKIQQGYNPDIFSRIDMRLQNRVSARNQAEKIVNGSFDAAYYADAAVTFLQAVQQYNSDTVRQEMAQFGKQRERVAGVTGEFIYVPNSDGKVTYFKDGLPSRVINERVADEFGVVSMKNTYNMAYNSGRLLTGYEADIVDVLGNKSHVACSDMTYMPNAKWYASDETRAHKNVASYTTVETDHAGNMRTVQWQAEGYVSHCLQAFSERIDSLLAGKTAHEVSSFRRFNIVYESIKGDRALSYEEEGEEAHAAGEGINAPTYRLTRSAIDYNTKNQITAYHEVKYTRPPTDAAAAAPLEQWVKTTTDANLDYQARPHQFGQDVGQDPSLLTATRLATLIENPDGSTRKENSLTAYAYDKLWKLENAAGTTDFTDTSVWYYTTVDGQNRDVVKTRVNGADAYYYHADPTDTASGMVFVDARQVKTGSNVSVGTAQTSYDILYGHPMVRQAHSTTFTYRPDRGPGVLDPDTGRPYEPFMAQESTIDYAYGLRNNFLRMTGTQETSTTFDPSDRALSNTETVATTYEYNALGNLENVFGTGFGGGYKFDEAQQLWLKRNNYTVSVSYNQDELDKLGRPLIDKKEILEIPE